MHIFMNIFEIGLLLNSEHLNKQAENSSNFYFIGIKYSMLFYS